MSVQLISRGGGKHLTGLSFDVKGQLHCCGNSDGKVFIVRSPGAEGAASDGNTIRPIELLGTGGAPSGLAFGSDDSTIFICDQARHALTVVTAAASSASSKAILVADEYDGEALLGPHSAIFDRSGQVFFTDSGPHGASGLFDARGSVFMLARTSTASTASSSSSSSAAAAASTEESVLRPLALSCLASPRGLALSPSDAALYVCEAGANRLVRFVQKPAGVFHASVFHQFSGRTGPVAIACDPTRDGLLYVARPESLELSDRGLIAVIDREGVLLKELEIIGAPDLSSLALSPDGAYLFACDAASSSIYRISLDEAL